LKTRAGFRAERLAFEIPHIPGAAGPTGKAAAHGGRFLRRRLAPHFIAIGGMSSRHCRCRKLLRAEAAVGPCAPSAQGDHQRFLPVARPHLDMWISSQTLRAKIRGEFNPIRHERPGHRYLRTLPRIARTADRFVFIRSMADCDDRHDAYQCMTGRKKDQQQANFWPAMARG